MLEFHHFKHLLANCRKSPRTHLWLDFNQSFIHPFCYRVQTPSTFLMYCSKSLWFFLPFLFLFLPLFFFLSFLSLNQLGLLLLFNSSRQHPKINLVKTSQLQISWTHIMQPDSLNEIVLLHIRIKGLVVSSKCGNRAFSLVPNIMFWDFYSWFSLVSFLLSNHCHYSFHLYLIVWLTASQGQNNKNEGKKMKARAVLLPSMSLWSYSLCLWKFVDS